VLNNYFQAIIKEPELIDTIEKKAKKRTGSFIGMLDNKIGDESYKNMKKSHPKDFLEAIDQLCSEITPYYLVHSDFVSAKNQFLDGVCNDFEDLLILQSVRRLNCVKFITNDKELLKLNIDMKISKP